MAGIAMESCQPRFFVLPDDNLFEQQMDQLMDSMFEDDDEPKKEKKKKKKDKKSTKIVSMEDRIKIEQKRKADEEKAKRREEEKARKRAERARIEADLRRKQAEIDLIQLIARRDVLRKKLTTLNPGKNKDAMKMAAINVELSNIQEAMDEINRMYGLNINNIDRGSKVGRFVQSVKTKIKAGTKKVNKFFRRNSELIQGLAAIVLPVLGSVLCGFMMKKAR